MKKNSSGAILLISVAVLALFTALSHMSCIMLGPECYRAQMAPEALIELSKSAPWRAAFETTLVSLLFVATAIFCLSGAGVIRKMPMLKPAIITISVICTLREIATLPLSMLFPEQVTAFSIIAGILWFFAGVSCFSGYRLMSIKNSTP
ncbi:hypothetical protein [Pseudoalteromonas phenolica]|uniref:hypothetical protein n=1 Tax=Pseudoalteromonas phenolica TaxID=161398 RepID=UPI00110B85E9|nr:hypothetical protein [Pseudoalteromonas phenolica]TMO56411.1 hypothetical protein CWC21_06845 [Pseudoalteromonas phenolica]